MAYEDITILTQNGINVDNQFFVYELIGEGETLPFYVGKSGNIKRPQDHIREALNESKKFKNKHKQNKIKKFIKENKKIIINIVFSSPIEEEANMEEIRLISLYGRKDINTGFLTNMTIGGDGVVGHKHTEEAKAKITKALLERDPEIYVQIVKKNKGKMVGMKGKTHTEEAKKKISDANTGRVVTHDFSGDKNPFFGKIHTEEAKQKMSDWRAENYQGEDNPFFGKTHTEEARAKISAAVKARTPETIAKMAASLRGKPWSEARRQAQIDKKSKGEK